MADEVEQQAPEQKLWTVEVLDFDDNVVRRLEYLSAHLAEKAERGVLRNLNTERYYTRIVEPK